MPSSTNGQLMSSRRLTRPPTFSLLSLLDDDELDETEQIRIIREIQKKSPRRLIDERWDWPSRARGEQLPPPGTWNKWLFLGGRGSGKTRAGAEWLRAKIEGGVSNAAIVGATAADARDIMVLGPAGLLAISPPSFRPSYEPSKRRVIWPNGAVAMIFSADEPERLRGHQHEIAWLDEVASWRYARDAYEMLMFGLRLGENPQIVVTTTPRPVD